MKKFLTYSIVAATIAWSLGLSAILPASAATAVDGDVIKTATSNAVYYVAGGKKMLMVNRGTYSSWSNAIGDTENNFANLKVVSQADFDAIPYGANATVRPGTELIHFTDAPDVYYAVSTEGKLYKLADTAAKDALYPGVAAVALTNSFRANYYDNGNPVGTLTATSMYPDGTLVKSADAADVYIIEGGMKRPISTDAWAANSLKAAWIRTTDVTGYTTGASVTGKEAWSSVPVSEGTVVVPTGTVSVSLASDTPALRSVPDTVGRVPFTKVVLTASADGMAKVESITVTRSGLSDPSKFVRVWAEKNGVAVTAKRTLSSNNEAILTLTPALEIAAGQSVALELVAELNGATGNGSLGIASASAVTGATAVGSFPIVGNLMSFVSYSVTQLTFAQVATANAQPAVGDEDVELGKFSINFGANPRDVMVTSVMIRNTGSEDLSSTLLDVYLEKRGEKVSEYGVIDGRYITFTFNGGLEMLKDDGDETFTIKADVIGKDGAGDLVLILNKKEDLVAKEIATGFGITPGHTDAVSINTVNIQSGVVNVAKKATSPSDTSVVGASNGVVALLANIRADQIINADGLKVQYSVSDLTSFGNVKVYLNNILLGSFDPTSIVADTSETIASSLTLNKGDNEVKILVDVKSNASTSATFKANLVGASGALLDTPEYASNGNLVATGNIAGTATGALLTVDAGSLTFTRNDGFASGRKIVQGTQDVILGKFAVKANNDDVRINSISLGANGAAGTQIGDSYLSDMKLFVDGVQLGTTRNFSGGATFSSLSYNLDKDASKVIELVGTLGTATGTFETLVTVNGQNSAGKSIDAVTASTTDLEVVANGELSAEALTSPDSTILLAGVSTEQTVANYRFTAIRDSAKVTEVTLTNVGTTTPTTTTVTDPRIASLKMYSGTTLIGTANPINGVATFNISGDNLLVPANSNKSVTVKAVLNSIDDAGQTDKPLTLRLAGIKASGSNGSELDTSSSVISGKENSQTMVIRQATVKLAKVNGITGSQSSAQEVARFTLTAEGGDVQITSTSFSLVGTGAASSSDFKLLRLGQATDVATSSDGVFTNFDLQISEGETATIIVRANTASVATDKTFGVYLSDVAGTNSIVWNEYFFSPTPAWVGGYDSTNLWELPLDFGTQKY